MRGEQSLIRWINSTENRRKQTSVEAEVIKAKEEFSNMKADIRKSYSLFYPKVQKDIRKK